MVMRSEGHDIKNLIIKYNTCTIGAHGTDWHPRG